MSGRRQDNPFLPTEGEHVHFRKKALQSEVGSNSVKTETVVEAVGEFIGILGDGRMTIKMTSWQDENGRWLRTRKGIMMNVHMDDVDL
jgi:hypothetical protein